MDLKGRFGCKVKHIPYGGKSKIKSANHKTKTVRFTPFGITRKAGGKDWDISTEYIILMKRILYP